eukprot:340600_1
MMTLHFLSIILITIFNLHIAITDSCTDSSNHNECDFCLYQTDFHFGTYRMTVSGLYCIEENIIFNPIPGNINFPNTPGAWFPSNDTHYSGCINLNDGAYALGFFAIFTYWLLYCTYHPHFVHIITLIIISILLHPSR